MGKPCLSNFTKFFAIVLLGAATAIAAIAVLSSPAAAKGGGGGGYDKYPWDTDNLRIGSTYSAKSFNIPFHKYGGYSGVAACQSGVADAFFQAGGSVGAVNDFPYLDWVADDAGNWSWAEQEGGTRRNGCDKFVEQQDEMAAQIGSNGGYYLDLSGNLQRLSKNPPSRVASRRLPYSHWLRKGDAFAVNSGTGELIASQDTSGYWVRVDGIKTGPNKYYLAIYPSGTTWTIPQNTQNGRFGNWHGTSYQRRTDSAVLTRVARPAGGITRFSYLQEAGLCPSGFHPRGEDSVDRIGSHTGRTLTGLTHAQGSIADQFWCRSDLRFGRRFHPEFHTGVAKHRQAATKEFTAYGRLNCYFTAFTSDSYGGAEGIRQDPASGGIVCSYLFPIPQCDPDPDNESSTDWRDYTAAEVAIAGVVGQPFNKADGADCGENTPQCTHNGTKRDMTNAELAEYRKDDASFTPKADGSTPCSANPADPPQQAGFTADPCVTAALEIYENRTAGGDAEPGVLSSDRTLAVAAGRTAFDLDIASPHPLTASAPKDTSDPSGCADGSENRADHAASSGGAARSQTVAPSYASSARTDTAAPPNDADGDIDYTGAVRNMAHRYASKVAENTCSVKRSEAEAELALLEAREAAFTQWLSDYKTAADSNAEAMRSYRRAAQRSGAELLVLQFNDIESNKAAYAAAKAPLYTALSGVLVTAKTNYDTATDRTTGSNRASVIATSGDSGCAAHYDAEIARLKALFAAAEKTATDAIKPAETAVGAARLASVPQITSSSPAAVRLPDISADLTRTETTVECLDITYSGGCRRAPRPGETCGNNCPGRTRTVTTRYYTCPGNTGFTVAGTFTGTYKTSRSRSYTGTYTASARGESTSSSCPGWRFSGTTATDAAAWVMGTSPSPSRLPALSSPAAAEGLQSLDKLAVLGSYHTGHADRANLEAASADTRNSAAAFTATTGTASGPAAVRTWQSAYKTAYDTAFTQATGHMSGTAWESFDWRYQTTTLDWGSYQEDPATTYSGWVAQTGETETDRNGTGCDLINVASDGTVSVEATRLDYETSKYGKGNVYGTRTDAQRTCKIRRTRTPELLLEYQPSAPSGTDTSKAAAFWHVNYQPTSASERFKLYDEAEVFAVKASLADRSPVLCYQPGEALVAHVGAKGIDAVHKTVFRNA